MTWQPLTWAALASAALIFSLRVVDVSIATVRMLAIIRGQRLVAWFLGFFQALVFVVAIRQVFANLDNIWNMIGYAAGFATGTVVGMWLEERLAMGYTHMRIISPVGRAPAGSRLRGNRGGRPRARRHGERPQPDGAAQAGARGTAHCHRF